MKRLVWVHVAFTLVFGRVITESEERFMPMCDESWCRDQALCSSAGEYYRS